MAQSASFELVYLDPISLQEGLTYSKLKRRQVKEEGNVRSQKHEQRRRRFMRYQDTNQQKLAKEYFNNEVIGQILNKATCEKKEDELRSIVLSYKDIMPQNRINRQLQISLLEQSDRNFLTSWETAETNREINWTLYLDTKSQNKRMQRLHDAGKYAERYENKTMVQEFLAELIDSILWVATCREIGCFEFAASNSDAPADLSLHLQPRNAATQAGDIIPSLILDDVRSLLVSPLPSAPALPDLHSMLASSMLLPFNISQRPKVADKDWLLHTLFSGAYIFGDLKDDSKSYALYLAKDSWLKFIEQLNEGSVKNFQVSHPLPEESETKITLSETELIALNRKVTGDRDAVLAPDWLFTYQPYHLLGEIVVQVRRILHPLPPQPDPPIDSKHIPFRGALFGISDVYKRKAVEAFLATIPRLTIIRAEEEVAKLIQLYNGKELSEDHELSELAKFLSEQLVKGSIIPDSVYVKLIVKKVLSLPAHNNGYLLADYPQTLEQLLQLMDAFSGVRFDKHRPQPSDFASLFAPHLLLPWTYDIAKSGLDLLLCVDSPEVAVSTALEQCINARRDLATQEVVYLNSSTTSVKFLQKLYDPTRPVHCTALQVTTAQESCDQIADFCKLRGLYDCISGEENILSKAQDVAARFIPQERLVEEYWEEYDLKVAEEARAAAELAEAMVSPDFHSMLTDVTTEEVVEEIVPAIVEESRTEEKQAQQESEAGEEEGAPVVAPAVTDSTPPQDETEQPVEVPMSIKEPPKPPVFEINKLHPALAAALDDLWGLAEQQSHTAGQSFYSSMRDVRFQMLQRKRMAIDSVNGGMIRLDDRQELFNKFRAEFNAVDDEMRFDPDCIAELHLMTLQFRNDLSKLCEQRMKEMQELIESIGADNNMKVFQHRCYCEASFFIQAEYNRFYTILQIILDYGKSIQGYELHEKIRNELEALLPITLEGYTAPTPPLKPAAGSNPKDAKGKEKDKKGKDAVNPLAPNRDLLAPNVLPLNMMVEKIPTARTQEEPPPDPKAAKGKPKDKKGAVEEITSANPFEEVEKLVLVDLAKWKAGTFSVNRELFENDENICQALESAVWFEAEKMAHSVQITKLYLEKHILWLGSCEADCLQLLHAVIHDRYLRELAAGEKVIDLIEFCIANAEPLDMLWLVSPDATAPVQPASLWKKWRILVPFVWLKQYEKTQKVKEGQEQSQASHAASGFGAPPGESPAQNEDKQDSNQPGGNQNSFYLNESMDFGEATEALGLATTSLDSYDSQISTSKARRALGGSRSTGKIPTTSSSSNHPPPLNLRPSTGGSSKRQASPGTGTRRQISASRRRGSSEAHLQRLRSPSTSTRNKTSPGSEDQLAKEHERYLLQRQIMEEKLLKIREAREAEFRSLGMSPSAAKLAAFNELLLEEQHQLADLEAQWKPTIARSRPRSSVRSTGGRRPNVH